MKSQILLVVLILTVGNVASAQTLQTVVNNGNTVTTPVKFNGRADFGESYDAGQYGAVQIARAENQGAKFHLSFIRSGQMVYGMGFLNNSNVFGIQPGSDNSVSNGIFMDQNGNAAVGTSNTVNRFTVFQNSSANTYLTVQNSTVSTLFGAAGVSYAIAGTSSNHDFTLYTNLTEKMRITTTGNVGIGTAAPTEKLSVKGKIRAQEIKVEMTNWPDFVLAKDYKLSSLLETEKLIKEKGHLPGIPSAAEVQANGVELGDMNKKLLQKIEELTLYLIEMKKENEASHKSNHAKNKKLQDQINKLNSKQIR
jgi:hypothetical protein